MSLCELLRKTEKVHQRKPVTLTLSAAWGCLSPASSPLWLDKLCSVLERARAPGPATSRPALSLPALTRTTTWERERVHWAETSSVPGSMTSIKRGELMGKGQTLPVGSGGGAPACPTGPTGGPISDLFRSFSQCPRASPPRLRPRLPPGRCLQPGHRPAFTDFLGSRCW